MNNTGKKPYVSPELITYLEQVFSDKVPRDKDVTLADIHRLQGKLEVIQHLKAVFNTQLKKQEI